MAFYPDVLDALGKTPREFGSLQVCVEKVVVADDLAFATLWFQAAFEPHDAQATFLFRSTHEAPVQLTQAQPVPPLSPGAVVRGGVRFTVPLEVDRVSLEVHSTIPEGAQRCRPAWKLFDTIEVPKQSELNPASNFDLNVGASVVGSLLGAPLGTAVLVFSGTTVASPRPRTVVHAAQTLSAGFEVAIERLPAPTNHLEHFETVWTPGQPLPVAQVEAPVAMARAPAVTMPVARSRRVCGQCDFSGKFADYAGDRYCPACGHEWA